MNSLLATPHSTILENAISASSLRHKVISDNIANVNTPEFKRSEVDFEGFLREAMNPTKKKLAMTTTNEKHLTGNTTVVAPTAVTAKTRLVAENSFRTDGNNVDIDIEMANMAKNTIYYNASVQQLNRYYSSLKTAINGGRG